MGCKHCLEALVAIALAAGAIPSASAIGSTALLAEPGRSYLIPLRTLKEIRRQAAFRATVHQQYDFSCGSAAVATLLTFHYGHPVSEAEVFRRMWERGEQAKIKAEGFSLLDMKRYLETEGYRADGVQVSLEELARVGVPAIALVSDGGYRHFVVVKGLRGDRIALGDPAVGARFVDRQQFESSWVGRIFFVIRSHLDTARFNAPGDWASSLAAPTAQAVPRDALGTLTLGIPDASRF